jgi:hypothetical protein
MQPQSLGGWGGMGKRGSSTMPVAGLREAGAIPSKEFIMNPRLAGILGGCLVLCCLILGASFGQPLAAQAPAARVEAPAGIGRFQVVMVGAQRGEIVVLDTATGHSWQRNVYGGAWSDLGTPPVKQAK